MAIPEPTLLSDGVVRLGTPLVNWYLVADESGVTIVDAGLPGLRPQLEPGLELLGRSLADVRAVLLTHGDGDHIGVAALLRPEIGTPVHLHPQDDELVHDGKQKKTDQSTLGALLRPGTWRLFGHFTRYGALPPKKIPETVPLADGQILEVPGSPRVLHTPGHTNGHVAFHFPEHGALFLGDALCTWHPISGRRGAQQMAFNVSTPQALASLEKVESLDAALVLVGHGEPWEQGPAAAVAAARKLAGG